MPTHEEVQYTGAQLIITVRSFNQRVLMHRETDGANDGLLSVIIRFKEYWKIN